jgi:hypothetical protein
MCSALLAACGSSVQKTAPGTEESTASLSLAQQPVRSGSARVIPAVLAQSNLIGPGTQSELTYGGPWENDPVEDPSGLIVTGAAGSSATGLAIASAGAVGGALSVATGLVLMGPLMLPWAYEEGAAAANRRSITESVVRFGFPPKLDERLRTEIGRAGTSAATDDRIADEVEFRVDSYGLAFKDTNRVACLIFRGTLTARRRGTTLYEDAIDWTPARRSADFSPVRCATIDDMARDDGQLVDEIFDEAVLVISAAIARRLRGRRQ